MAYYYLYPASVSSTSMNAVGAANCALCVDDPWNSPDEATTYADGADATANTALVMTFDNLPTGVAWYINSVTMLIRESCSVYEGPPSVTQRHFRCHLITDGSDYYSGNLDGDYEATPVWRDFSYTWTTNPKTGKAWTGTEVDALTGGINENATFPAADTVTLRYTQVYLRVDYLPIISETERAREVASRRLLMRRRGRYLVDLTGPLEFADAELLGDIAYSHYALLDYDGAAIDLNKIQSWRRRNLRVLSSTIDPMRNRVSLQCRDLRDGIQLRTLWDSGLALTSGAIGDGIARVGCGGTRTFSRDSQAWVVDPADGIIRQVEADVEAYDAAGTLIEGASTNYILNSAFASGTTSWTVSAGVAVDTTDVLWDTQITPNSMKLDNGAGGATRTLAQTTGSITVAAGSISVTHKDDGASALKVTVQRASDSGYLQSDLTWAAGAYSFSLTVRATATRDVLADAGGKTAINFGGATTVTVTISGGVTTAAKTWHVYDVQLENVGYATSRILTTTAAVTRAAADLSMTLPDAARSCWPAQGTLYIRLTPDWIGTVKDTATAIQMYWSANEKATLIWNGSEGEWWFYTTTGGTDATAAKFPASPAANTAYAVGIRWTSSQTELGLAATTLSVFVAGTKGTDSASVTLPTPAYAATLYLLKDQAGTAYFDGAYKDLFITPFVLSDAEIARLPVG